MERNILIPQISFGRWNKAEKTTFIDRYVNILLKLEETSDPGQPSIQSTEVSGIESLHISAEQVEQLQELRDKLLGLNRQTSASRETSELSKADKKRVQIGKYIVNRILDVEELPMDDEIAAAEKMYVEILPYKNFQRIPVGQKSSVIKGLLVDLEKPEFTECIETLALAEPISELKLWNAKYEELEAQRTSKKTIKAETETATVLTKDAEILINNMNDYANASSLLNPSEEASQFIRDVIKLYDSARLAYNKRGNGKEEETPQEGTEEGEETEGTDTPEGENPPAEDDRPTVN